MKGLRVRRNIQKKATGTSIGVQPSYVVEPLDPWLRCGPDTTVTELWRVRERRERDIRFHLVYFDRYGWYCEHGRRCEAVAEVRRAIRTMSATVVTSKRGVKTGARKRK